MASEWRITHNSGRYRIEYLLERGNKSVIGLLTDCPREDVWVPACGGQHYDSYDVARNVAELRFGNWEPVTR